MLVSDGITAPHVHRQTDEANLRSRGWLLLLFLVNCVRGSGIKSTQLDRVEMQTRWQFATSAVDTAASFRRRSSSSSVDCNSHQTRRREIDVVLRQTGVSSAASAMAILLIYGRSRLSPRHTVSVGDPSASSPRGRRRTARSTRGWTQRTRRVRTSKWYQHGTLFAPPARCVSRPD